MKRFYATGGGLIVLGVAVALVLAWGGARQPSAPRVSSPAAASPEPARGSAEPILPIPLQMDLDPHRVALGEALFHDPILSRDGRISCASCHRLSNAGVDGLVVPIGIDGRRGSANTPTVFNSGFNFRQFWDGRARTLEEQIDGPVHSLVEMASTWPDIVARLEGSPRYVSAFDASYPEGITPANVKDAIATFERSLYTPNSRFDRFLRGEEGAISEDERAGYRLFKSFGCVSCHQGVNVGGNMFQRFGVMVDFFAGRREVAEADLGHFNVTGEEVDRHVFKVPSLRLAALTAPYFHDGSAATLEAAVTVMGWYQLRRRLEAREVHLLVDFLQTLPGEYKGRALDEQLARSDAANR